MPSGTEASYANAASAAAEAQRSQISFQYLMVANGLTEEDLKQPDRVTSIEMVLDDYCCMKTLNIFTRLRSVCLIQQAISKIEGLDKCYELERLLLNENRITSLEGLGNCAALKQLHICTNAIEEIGNGLCGLVRLETLWIAENQLKGLQGLAHAPNLTEINVARNQLTTTVDAFNGNARLTKLNLSDNKIGSYREVLGLRNHPKLRELAFADPDWGENPICLLCNYATYTLYHLPQIQVHDRMRIGEDEHTAAQAAFSKKSLFYNMRVKLTRRQAAEGLRAARTLNEERAATLQREFEAVARTLRRFGAAARGREANPAETQPPPEAGEAGFGTAPLHRHARESRRELADTAAMWTALVRDVRSETEALARGLRMELQTGGNIRMEQGSLERDPWFRHIDELVTSRFRAEELAHFGVCDIKVVSVTRVHNRSLRIRFEQLLEDSESDSAKQVEYLFYVHDPRRPAADIRDVIEEGFVAGAASSAGENTAAAKGYDAAPKLLTNSVGVVLGSCLDYLASSQQGQAFARASQRALRLAAAAGEPARVDAKVTATAVSCGGQMLVCSTCLFNSQPDMPACFDSVAGDVRDQWIREPSGTALDAAAFGVPSPSSKIVDAAPAELEGGWRSVYRTGSDDPRQKVWHSSCPDAVLPEFLVEFDFVYSSGPLRSAIKPRPLEWGSVAGVIRDFAVYAQLGVPARAAPTAEEEIAEKPVSSLVLPDLVELPVNEIVTLANCVDPKLHILPTADTGALRNLLVLNLHGRGVRRIDAGVLELFPNLTDLLLSFNRIESLSWLPKSDTVKTLDVSFNLVQAISSLNVLPSLKHLDMSWNSLLSLEAVSVIARDVPELESLAFEGNPLARESRYRNTVLEKMTSLKTFDDREVAAIELGNAQDMVFAPTELTEDVLMKHSFSSKITTAPSKAPLDAAECGTARVSIAQLLSPPENGGSDAASIPPAPSSPSHSAGVTRANWQNVVEEIDLCGLDLTGITDLSRFTMLRRLRLNRNAITSVREIAASTSLEELAIEENQLDALSGLASLVNLRRLDAGANRLTGVLELSRLPRLSQLSLEDNYIDSFDTFASLHEVMELYLSNNLIEELRSVLMLKQLPKLIVLDLSGNDLCLVPDYRCYVVFHLRRLKVLDGSTITQVERQEAEEKFSGKITLEMLENHLGPSPTCYNFRSVDLSNQSLRELGNFMNDDMFPSLRELNLDGNPFTDIRNVGPFTKLMVLRLSRSKIDLEKGVIGDGEEFIGGLNTMPSLQVLDMAQCGITDMSFFERVRVGTLRILHLQGNEITRVEGISHLEHLRELVLDRNKVKILDENSFMGLKSLRELRMDENHLKSFEHIGPLPRLHALHLSSNRIAEMAELEKLRLLKQLVIVHLASNPVARKPLYRAYVINAVRLVRAVDGREVTEEERDKADLMLNPQDPKGLGQGVYMYTDVAGTAPGQAPPMNIGSLGTQPQAPAPGLPGPGAWAGEDNSRRVSSQFPTRAQGGGGSGASGGSGATGATGGSHHIGLGEDEAFRREDSQGRAAMAQVRSFGAGPSGEGGRARAGFQSRAQSAPRRPGPSGVGR